MKELIKNPILIREMHALPSILKEMGSDDKQNALHKKES